MAITEASRHHMVDQLTEAIGQEAAMTLAEHLPPVGWADVATKADLSHLSEHMDARFAQVDARFAQVDARFAQVDARFDRIDERFDWIDERFTHQDQVWEHRLEAAVQRLRQEITLSTRTTGLWNTAILLALIGILASVR